MRPFRPLALLVALLAVLGCLPAQGVQRQQPSEPDWQGQIDQAFGTALNLMSALPFHDLAQYFGAGPTPLTDASGAPAATSTLLTGHTGAVRVAAFADGEDFVATADDAYVVRLWSLHRARWRANAKADDKTPEPVVLKVSLPKPVTAIALFPGETEMAIGLDDGSVNLFRLARDAQGAYTATPLTTIQHPGVSAIAYSANGRWLATGSSGTLRLWDGNCQQALELSGPTNLTGLQFVGDEVLLAEDNQGGVMGWKAVDGTGGVPDGAKTRWLPTQGITTTIDAGGQKFVLGGHTKPLIGARMGSDRAMTWGPDGARVHEWYVRGPNGAVATVGVPLVVMWLVVAAVFFTLLFRFVNFRLFKHAIHCVQGRYSDPKDAGEVSHFQALSTALSATVGLGNIAGVAIAVSIGGPGATFWMIVAGLLGMTLKFTECTLGQKFRKIDANGAVSGGPMHYLKDGLAQRGLAWLGAPLALIFSIFCIGGSLAGGNSFQVSQSLDILREQVPALDSSPWVYGLIMAVATGIVIIGGLKRIAKVADKIVPIMCGLYVLCSLIVIVLHLGHVPAALANIFAGALSGDAVYGGAIGSLVMGFRRASFSNEAGVGSASIAHSAAKTPYPVREGIVALLEPFIDTVVVCTMTALVIGITGVYNAPEHAELVAGGRGAALTKAAFEDIAFMRSWYPWLLTASVVMFAWSTMISWSYYGERCCTNLFGPKASLPFKLLFLVFTFLGSVVTARNVLEFGDLMILLMAFPNILGLYLLSGVVQRELGDYEQKLGSGEIRPFQ